ncbi:MAG: VOC family protein [Bacteroidota bacterium]
MTFLKAVHHIAIICSDYKISKHFYTAILGCEIISETYRDSRNSYKLDLSLHGQYIIELFSFPNPAKRPSGPEATGLRHLAFEVDDIKEAVAYFEHHGIIVEPTRVDLLTHKKFTFFRDPDDLPIELYEL